MPYKFETTFLIRPEDDKRRKLSEEQKDEIREKYSMGLYSQRGLAKEYIVSKRLIHYTIHPDKLKKDAANHDSKKYYDKDKHREYMRTYRANKKKLNIEGKLIKK